MYVPMEQLFRCLSNLSLSGENLAKYSSIPDRVLWNFFHCDFLNQFILNDDTWDDETAPWIKTISKIYSPVPDRVYVKNHIYYYFYYYYYCRLLLFCKGIFYLVSFFLIFMLSYGWVCHSSCLVASILFFFLIVAPSSLSETVL